MPNSCVQDRDALVKENGEASQTASLDASSEDFVSDLLSTSYKLRRPGIGEMRHGTEGWQALETSFVVHF